jgi:hypothetical protein
MNWTKKGKFMDETTYQLMTEEFGIELATTKEQFSSVSDIRKEVFTKKYKLPSTYLVEPSSIRGQITAARSGEIRHQSVFLQMGQGLSLVTRFH